MRKPSGHSIHCVITDKSHLSAEFYLEKCQVLFQHGEKWTTVHILRFTFQISSGKKEGSKNEVFNFGTNCTHPYSARCRLVLDSSAL